MSWSAAALAALSAAIVLGLICEYRLARKSRNRFVVREKPAADPRDWQRQFEESLKS